MARERRYWLFKSEPETFSFDDLLASPGKTTGWDGVRNYQARNMLRDEIQKGDGVLFYHSRADPPAVVGLAQVAKGGRPDPTAFDPKDPHFDSKSDPEDPRWFLVDIRGRRALKRPVTLPELKSTPALSSMLVVQRGQRLSIQPVTPEEWAEVCRLGGVAPF